MPTGNGIIAVSLSYPVIEPSTDPLLTRVTVGEQDFALEKVVDVNVMARRALKDEMPGMVLRGATRALAKGVMQDQLQKNAGVLGGLIGALAAVTTEKADDRMWRMLPGRVYVARGYLPPGEHRLTIDGRPVDTPIRIDGQYALVPVRLYHNVALVGQVATAGHLPESASPTPVAPTAAAQTPTPAAKRAARANRAAKAAAPAPAATAAPATAAPAARTAPAKPMAPVASPAASSAPAKN